VAGGVAGEAQAVVTRVVIVKDPSCDLIMVAAKDWAAATSWQPGPADA
jgi:hypothetical protein